MAYDGYNGSTIGGEGAASVYHVTNMNDTGSGSLRNGLSFGPRRIVFDVGGTITMASTMDVNASFLTIDGTTAPSPGVTLNGQTFRMRGSSGAHDIIVKGLRIRNSAFDNIQINSAAYNIVIDQCSLTGALDGNLDISGDSITLDPTKISHNITVTRCLLGGGGSHKNSLLKFYANRMSLYNNIYVLSNTRNPLISVDSAGTLETAEITADFRNNLIWGWFGEGTKVDLGAKANIMGNFYSTPSGGSSDKANAIIVNSPGRAYLQNNYSADALSFDLNTRSTETSAFPSATISNYTNNAVDAAIYCLNNAGTRTAGVLDAIDTALVSGISLSTSTFDTPALAICPYCMQIEVVDKYSPKCQCGRGRRNTR